MRTTSSVLQEWVEECAVLAKPDHIHWCDGSEAEAAKLTQLAVETNEFIPLNPEKNPGSYLHRSAANDVARTESLTFICTKNKEDAGPTNNWMAPAEAYQKLSAIFDGSMRGRTMYVVPFLMGVPGSKFAKIGVQLTDSVYVALSMRVMTHMGAEALRQLGDSSDFTRCFHGKADVDDKRRFICHFPEDNTVWSVGSDYGGNALLGKKCLALRIASYLAKNQGWLAEHMLILGIQDPQGQVRYVCAAFPSQCGKTNLAMIVPPEALVKKGYKVWTVGDDIAWLHVGDDGRLWAVNPEAGFFGVAPGTNAKTNPTALATIQKNTIFTNVALKKDNSVWWEGLSDPPAEALDWQGRPWTPESKTLAAHPNSRFAVSASQCPSISPEWQNPQGVPISAIVFGGRRAKLVPLVYESFSWNHGVYLGATMASETTAAATGKVGVVRRDPMAMLPFCGYHMADYFKHWIEMGKKLTRPPRIFYVNWFRAGKDGKMLWPGFGENLRVVLWMLDREAGKGEAKKTSLGWVPSPETIDHDGMTLDPAVWDELLAVDHDAWVEEAGDEAKYLSGLGDRVPQELWQENKDLIQRLKDMP